ncbi:MAG: exonuclease, partial [Delftia acidovorans]
RGNAMEDEARQHYAFVEVAEIHRVGFIRNGNKGASPDSLVGDNGGLEIKTALPHIQIDRLERDRLPPEHKAQVQGNLWLSEREWWDFVSYWPKLPILTVRVYRDEDYIKTMADEIDRFNDELAALVERIRHYGMKEAA